MNRRHLKIILFLSLISIVYGCSEDADRDTSADAAVARDAALPDAAQVDAAADAWAGDGPKTHVRIPRDESPHSDPVEWWYYTGRLVTETNEVYGFEFVIFQVHLASVGVYPAHFAISDLNKKTFKIASRMSYTDQSKQTKGFVLKAGEWQLKGGGGTDSFSAKMPGYELNLTVKAKKPLVLQYGNGEMTVGSTAPFYYYSYTNMVPSGTITVDGVAKKIKSGKVWMDHQWGDMGLGHDGWDWFSLRLDDETEVMLFVVRRKTGNFYGGTFITKEGRAVELKQKDFVITPSGTWTSPHTKAKYPLGWRIQVPKYKLDVTVDPQIKDQEFTISNFGTPLYWEGICDTKGTSQGKAVTGHTYIEMTGYDHPPKGL